MEETRFDDLLRSHVNAPSRRSVVQLLAALAASGLVGLTRGNDSVAKKHKSRKAALCLDGQTVFVGKKARKSLLSQGAKAGACLTPPPPPPLPPPCVKSCAGKQCGSDGCGGQCGACSPAQTCRDDTCVVVCVPQCNGRACGPDSCGGECGICPGIEECEEGRCCAPCLVTGHCCPEGDICVSAGGNPFCLTPDN
jgi:hypothetical protein